MCGYKLVSCFVFYCWISIKFEKDSVSFMKTSSKLMDHYFPSEKKKKQHTNKMNGSYVIRDSSSWGREERWETDVGNNAFCSLCSRNYLFCCFILSLNVQDPQFLPHQPYYMCYREHSLLWFAKHCFDFIYLFFWIIGEKSVKKARHQGRPVTADELEWWDFGILLKLSWRYLIGELLPLLCIILFSFIG